MGGWHASVLTNVVFLVVVVVVVVVVLVVAIVVRSPLETEASQIRKSSTSRAKH